MSKKLLKAVETIFPEFDFSLSDTDCIFGVKQVERKSFKDENKNLINVQGKRYIFISSEFPPKGNLPSFRYVVVHTRSEKRNYRCKNFHDFEYEKRYYSANTDERLIVILTKANEQGEI